MIRHDASGSHRTQRRVAPDPDPGPRVAWHDFRGCPFDRLRAGSWSPDRRCAPSGVTRKGVARVMKCHDSSCSVAVSSFFFACAARPQDLDRPVYFSCFFRRRAAFPGAESAEIRHFRSGTRAKKKHTMHKFLDRPHRNAARMGRRGRGAGKAAPGMCQEMSWSVMFLRFRTNTVLQCVPLPLGEGDSSGTFEECSYNVPEAGVKASGAVIRCRVRAAHAERSGGAIVYWGD